MSALADRMLMTRVGAERLMDRAHEIAAAIMRAPRNTRRATHALASRPWKQLFARDQGYHLAQQMYALQLQLQSRPGEQWQRYSATSDGS
jgi:hypothetical protein